MSISNKIVGLAKTAKFWNIFFHSWWINENSKILNNIFFTKHFFLFESYILPNFINRHQQMIPSYDLRRIIKVTSWNIQRNNRWYLHTASIPVLWERVLLVPAVRRMNGGHPNLEWPGADATPYRWQYIDFQINHIKI